MRHSIVLTIILSLICGFTLTGYADIICFSEDGKVEMEPINSDCCSPEGSSPHNSRPADYHDEGHDCTNCSDIEIDRPFWSKRVSSFSKYNFQLLPGLAQPVLPHSLKVNLEHSVFSKDIFNNSSHTEFSETVLKTTVVLC